MKNLKHSECSRTIPRMILENFLAPEEVRIGMEQYSEETGSMWKVGEIWHGNEELEKFVQKEKAKAEAGDASFDWNLHVAIEADDMEKYNYNHIVNSDRYKDSLILLVYESPATNEDDDNWCFVIYGFDDINNCNIFKDYTFKIDAVNRWKTSDKLEDTNKVVGVFENIYNMRIKKFNEHWTDSKALTDLDDALGVLDDVDTIVVDEDNVNELPELSHIMTAKDDQAIRNHYNTAFGLSNDIPNISMPNTYVGKTLLKSALETDKMNGGDYEDEYLKDFICVLFPKKYKPN